jgi:hypothetical protein
MNECRRVKKVKLSLSPMLYIKLKSIIPFLKLLMARIVRDISHAIVAGLPLRWLKFNRRSGHVGPVVDRVTLGQVFSE